MPIRPAVVLLAALAAGGCYLFPKEERTLAPPLIPPSEVTYDVLEAARGVIEDKVTGTGSFVAVDQTNHYFTERGGRLKVVHVTYGDDVSRGDVLAELNTAGLRNEIRQQEMVVEKARLIARRLEDSYRGGHDLALARLDVELARIDLADAERDLEGTRLRLSVDTSDTEVRARLSDHESAWRRQQVRLEKADIALARLQAEIAGRYALEAALADVALAELKLENLGRELEESKLRATLSGKVVYINSRVEEGDYINAYQTLVTVANPQELRLQYSGFNASDFLMGMKVDVEYEDRSYAGEVVMTPATVPFDAPENMKDKVHIRVDGLPRTVEMGDYASISLVLARREDVIVLPRRVVRSYLGRRYVQILEEGLVKERDVQTGLETPTEVEIVRGLEPGQKVVTR